MKLRSFRWRLALLSAIFAGSTLVGFALTTWFLIFKVKVAQLDSELKTQVLKRSVRPFSTSDWQSYQQELPSILRITSHTAIALLILDSQGKPIYRSPNWSSTLDAITVWPPPPPFTLPLGPPDPLQLGEYLPPPPQRRDRNGEFLPPPPFPPPGEEGHFPQPPPLPPSEDSVSQSPRRREPPVKLSHAGGWRMGTIWTPHTRLAIAVSLQGIDQDMSTIRNAFFISIPLGIVLVAFGAWTVSGSALQPLRDVSATIQRVTAKGLDRRIAIESADVEFLELLQVFNQMMERLERSFHQASRFSADAAHELKTPLAILHGELERMLQKAEFGSEQQQGLSTLLDEVCRLSEIVRKLLLLSRADAGQMRLHQVEIDLSGLLAEMAEDVEMLAPELKIQTKIESGLRIQGDRDLLLQVFHNLMSNAIKYNIPSGWLRIEAQRQTPIVSITVSNASHTIPANERERIFDRFYRGDPARTRQVEGLGLGLGLSREIARAHHGDLTLKATPAGQTAFILTLPQEGQTSSSSGIQAKPNSLRAGKKL